MRTIDDSNDFEPITPFLPRKEAEAALQRWIAEHGEIADNDLMRDVGRAADGKTVFRFQRRRSTARDIQQR
jgi:hypothetical protein